ncbi:LexA family transcriptional regulator [Halomonas colorata]|uniref:LexA family transcriptional regulator n=1 Tax=Halomonas colorata TaxID=2742615 RepID=UPI001866F727|nr:LexA family transcriptional regulator [Halomonas colorata]
MNEDHLGAQVLERLRIAYGVKNDQQLSKAIGRAPSTIHNWSRNGNIPTSECIEAAKTTGVSLDWLLLGEGVAPGADEDSLAEQKDPHFYRGLSDPNIASIPMYDVECAAGSGRDFTEEKVLGYFHMDRAVLAELKLPDSGVWVRARGDSMDGTIDDGDYVFVDFNQRDPSREGVYLILMDGERRLKRMQRVAGGGWLLISDNTRYDKELIAPDKKQFVEVLGRCLVNLGQVL